ARAGVQSFGIPLHAFLQRRLYMDLDELRREPPLGPAGSPRAATSLISFARMGREETRSRGDAPIALIVESERSRIGRRALPLDRRLGSSPTDLAQQMSSAPRSFRLRYVRQADDADTFPEVVDHRDAHFLGLHHPLFDRLEIIFGPAGQ